jgi:predicted nuclease of predicted toxin-antitoxin system
MRLLLDENVDFRVVSHLKDLGHDVKSIAHDFPAALDDETVLALALDEQRVLITNDIGFGDLVVRHRLPHAGILLLRLSSTDPNIKSERIGAALREHAAHLSELVVVSDGGVRIRRTSV